LRFLVIGCGSIGQRHIRNLVTLGNHDVLAFDPREDRRSEVESRRGVSVVDSLEEAWSARPEAAVICSPTGLHVDHALEAARNGAHLFVEKPLSDRLDGIEEVTALAGARQLITLVACNFRFHPGLQLAKRLVEEGAIGRPIAARAQFGQYLPDWHPREDYRHGYSAQRALGGGVILDQVHELDNLRWLLGEVAEVFCFAGRLSDLEIDTEDTASILLRFRNGALAQVHLDYVQRAYERSLQLIGDQGTIWWSFQDKLVRWYTSSDGMWRSATWPAYETNEMYVAEMRHFLRCLSGEETPALDLDGGRRVLEIALAAKTSAERRESITLSDGVT
jgi:predicted dehydrogenase